jgi:N4-gp56 family major capsid protein
MAVTSYGLNAPEAVKKWSRELFHQTLKQTYAGRFMGTGSNALCQVKSDLTDAGDRVRVTLRMLLTGDGIQGDGTLEGNEEALVTYTDDVYIDQLRHAVRSGGKMTEQRIHYSIRDEARDGLADWWADRIDYWFFNQLAGNTDQTDTRYTGNQVALAPTNSLDLSAIGLATSTASLGTSDVFQIKHIDYMIEKAKTATYPIRPIKVGGQDYYVLFISEEQATDMRQDYSAGGWGDLQKAAIQGGKITGNPIFTGALGMYNNTIIHSTTRLPRPTTTTRRAVFCGAQAAALAFGKGYSNGNKYSWKEEMFDYGNQLGVGAGCIAGLKKLQFNSTDFGTITHTTYAASHG